MPTFPGSFVHPSPPIFYPTMAPQTAPMSFTPVTSQEGFNTLDFNTTQVREKLIEVPRHPHMMISKHIQEKIVQVPKTEVFERKVAVPKTVYKEKVIEVPQVQYREVPVERIIEVPEVQTQVVVKEVEVPVQVDVPIIQPRRAPVEQQINRNIPMPIDLHVRHRYEIPKLKPKYKEVPVPIYVPRYIELPHPAQFVNAMQGGPTMLSAQQTTGGEPSHTVTRTSSSQPQAGRNITGPMTVPVQSRIQSARHSATRSCQGTGEGPVAVN